MKYTKHIALAILLAVWTAISWFKHNSDWHIFKSPPAVAPVLVPTPPAPLASEVIGAEAPVIAKIDWADPLDPRAIPFRGNLSVGMSYLFDTKDGIQIWDEPARKLSRLELPISDVRLDDKIWMTMSAGGTLAQAIMVTTRQSPVRAKLLLFADQKPQVLSQFDFPEGFVPSAFVKLTDSAALFCSEKAHRAIVLRSENKALSQVTAAMIPLYDQDMFTKAGVIGPVEGFGELTLPARQGVQVNDNHIRPVIFDTRRCAWSARNLPEPLASGLQLTLIHRAITTFSLAPVIVAASWIDPVTKEPKTLTTPLVWSQEDQKWRKRQPAEYPGLHPAMLSGMGDDDRAFSMSVSLGKFAFLLPQEDQWQEAKQRLPATESLKLVSYDWSDVLALLIDAKNPGRIVRLGPAPLAVRQGNFSDSHTYISLHQGELMVLKGSESAAMLVTPKENVSEKLASMPQSLTYPSGIALSDGSVFVFGGLDAGCPSYVWPRCNALAQGSYRWLPAQKRWQPVPSLSVPYSSGVVLNDNDGHLPPRSDFVQHNGNELFYLSNNGTTQGERSAPTHLYHWQLDGATETLARTRVNRESASLIELNDGRLAAIGGAAAGEPASPVCESCLSKRKILLAEAAAKIARQRAKNGGDNPDDDIDPESMVPPCQVCEELNMRQDLKFARTCEIYDRKTDKWSPGPFPNHVGGKAVKLANGRLFKFGLQGYSTTDANYVAETADSALSQWTATPPFPFRSPARVKHMLAVGNQVLFVMEKPSDQYVIWDDALRQWSVHDLPSRTNWSMRSIPDHVSYTESGQLLLLFRDRFEYQDWPLK